MLHNFAGGTDGASGSGLIKDANGNLYGVTAGGGIYQCGYGGCGTVYELPSWRQLWHWHSL